MYPLAPTFEVAQPRSLPRTDCMVRARILGRSPGNFADWLPAGELENMEAIFLRENSVIIGGRHFVPVAKVLFLDEAQGSGLEMVG